MTNLRDPLDEHARQIDLVRPRVVFIETRLLDSTWHAAQPRLRDRGDGPADA